MMGAALREAARSLRRSPGLAALMVIGLGLGLAMWMTARGALRSHTRQDHGPAHLFHVERPAEEVKELEGSHEQWTINHLRSLVWSLEEAEALTRPAPALTAPGGGVPSAVTFLAEAPVAREGRPPEATRVRLSTASLYALFERALREGRLWTPDEVARGEDVALLDAELADEWFPRGDALEQRVLIAGRSHRVVGVLAPRDDQLELFDFGWLREPGLHVPLERARTLEVRPLFARTSGLGAVHPGALARAHVWVALPDAEDRARYLAGAEARLADLDRRERPRLRSLAEWRARAVPVHPGYSLFELFAAVGLLACTFSLARLFFARFLVRCPEVGLRRALGASRGTLLFEHLVEAALIGLAAGALGLGLGRIGLVLIHAAVPGAPVRFTFDLLDLLACLGVALAAAVFAALVPAWRISRASPTTELRVT